ncbi:MAG: putative lactone hydrolase [Massilia sp.]|jgi:3-oxoadipate enol-lactonase|nr:putative lactone hydrolase [Massilia sp.]MDB5951025.1 putative lactone hydrolase [Massilia sp.]
MSTTYTDTASSALARDGARIGYTLRHGTAGGPRIVLVHSLAMNREFWAPVAERLAPYADVLTYDCRGHGASDKPAGPYSVAQFAGDLADLLDHVGWRSAAVAGASMGGSVALGFAAAHGDRVDALGLIDTTAWYGADAAQKWAERAVKAHQEGLQALVAFQQTRWFSDAFRDMHPAVVAASVSTFLGNDVAAFAATCAMLGDFDQRAALARLTMPTVVVVGEEDYATPVPMARGLHQGISGSSFHLIPGARHLTPLECPDVIADVLIRLMTKEDK